MAQQHSNQMQQIKRALKSQEVALKELKKDNLDLYNKAIQVTNPSKLFTSNSIPYSVNNVLFSDLSYLYLFYLNIHFKPESNFLKLTN